MTIAILGGARLGGARLGAAGRGEARQGKAWVSFTSQLASKKVQLRLANPKFHTEGKESCKQEIQTFFTFLRDSSLTIPSFLKSVFICISQLVADAASGLIFLSRRQRRLRSDMATKTSAEILIACKLIGVRPLMFDRYAGDNSTSLPVHEKLYLDDQRRLTLPAVNLFSMLCAENTKSVCRQFFGRNGKTIGLGMASYVTITPFEIPICDDEGQITFKGFNQQVYEHRTVARLAKGIPNPKQRPVIAMPWNLQFTMSYIENKYCSLENLRQALTMGGMLGVGTFRPFFGRYEVEQFRIDL